MGNEQWTMNTCYLPITTYFPPPTSIIIPRMERIRHTPDRDRLSALTAIILLAYALARFIALPAGTVDLSLFGSALGIELDASFILMTLVAALIGAGSDSLIKSHPTMSAAPPSARLPHWILPGGAALGLGLGLNRLPVGVGWGGALAVSAIFLILVLIAEFTVSDPDDAAFYWAALGLTALAYAIALMFFVLFRASSDRAALTASASLIVSALIAARLLLLAGAELRESALYGGVIGLIMGESTWALNYWPAGALGTGLILLVVFYLCTGLAQQHLVGKLTRRVLIEFGVVGIVGLLAVFRFGLFL